MLVLTRRSGEKIRIAEDITITVLRIQGNSIRLGIEAPRSVSVVRAELPPQANQVASPESKPIEKPPISTPVTARAGSQVVHKAPHRRNQGPLARRVSRRRLGNHGRNEPQARLNPTATHSDSKRPMATWNPPAATPAISATLTA